MIDDEEDSGPPPLMNVPGLPPDYTTPGQDYLTALQGAIREAGEHEADDALRGIVEALSWKALSRQGRSVFERAALAFLSEGE